MKRKYKVLIFVIAGIALLIGITAISLSVYMPQALWAYPASGCKTAAAGGMLRR